MSPAALNAECARRIVLSTALLAACAGPSPPPPAPRAELLELTPYPSPFGDHVIVLGLPGCAEPRLDVVGVSLENAEPTTEGFVALDGSFLLELPGREGDVLRIQTAEHRRSEPIDVVAAFGTPPLALPLAPCVEVPTHVDLAGGVARVEIANRCAAPVEVSRLTWRAPSSLTVSAEAPFAVPSGRAVELEVAQRESGAVDAVLLVELRAPELERRAVTIVTP